MSERSIERLPPETVRDEMRDGKALLVCAYDDEEKCAASRLTGAITLGELESQLPLPDEVRIVFYCA